MTQESPRLLIPNVHEAESLEELVADCVDVRLAVDGVGAGAARGPAVAIVIPDRAASLVEGLAPYGG
jgi:hypothetical protein